MYVAYFRKGLPTLAKVMNPIIIRYCKTL